MIDREIIAQSIDFMLLHINDNITVRDVAEHFHYSESYFSHSFRSIANESVYAFIKQLKMNQSAIDIKLKKTKSLTDIGIEYGYSSSNYSSAFKLQYNITPTRFRENTNKISIPNPFHPEILNHLEDYETYDANISITQIDAIQVIYERVLGNYENLKDKWYNFFDKYKNYIKEDTLILERFFDDPTISSAKDCICDLCISVGSDCTLENATTLNGGKFVTYQYNGKINDIFATLQGIFAIWFPNSGYEMDRRYGLNIYREIDMENNNVIMDLCIPIK